MRKLIGSKLLLVDVVDASGNILQAALVAVDTVGAGVGDQVLLVQGSASPTFTECIQLTSRCFYAVVDDVRCG